MPHPMYEIDSYLPRFPQFGSALEKLDALIEGKLFWTIGEMGLINLPKKIIETVDKNIDGTDVEKQAIMIGALHAFAQVTAGRQSGYDAETLKTVSAVLSYDLNSVASESVARVHVVCNIALTDAMKPMMEGMAGQVPAEVAREMLAGQRKMEQQLLPNLNAPRLAAAMKAETASMLTMLGIQQDDAPVVRKPKRPGFQP